MLIRFGSPGFCESSFGYAKGFPTFPLHTSRDIRYRSQRPELVAEAACGNWLFSPGRVLPKHHPPARVGCDQGILEIKVFRQADGQDQSSLLPFGRVIPGIAIFEKEYEIISMRPPSRHSHNPVPLAILSQTIEDLIGGHFWPIRMITQACTLNPAKEKNSASQENRPSMGILFRRSD